MGRVKFVNSLQSLFSERERHSLNVGGDIFERNNVKVHLRMHLQLSISTEAAVGKLPCGIVFFFLLF